MCRKQLSEGDQRCQNFPFHQIYCSLTHCNPWPCVIFISVSGDPLDSSVQIILTFKCLLNKMKYLIQIIDSNVLNGFIIHGYTVKKKRLSYSIYVLFSSTTFLRQDTLTWQCLFSEKYIKRSLFLALIMHLSKFWLRFGRYF